MIKVLLAEDDALYRRSLRTLLPWEQEGFTVCAEAINGLDALRRMPQVLPGLLVTDISMPGMNGVELIRAVKERFPKTAILVLSAYDDFEYVKEALKNGAEDYFLKMDLNEHLDQFLDILRGVRVRLGSAPDDEPQINRRLQINTLLWYIVSGKFANADEASASVSQAFLTSYFSRYCPAAVTLCEVGRTDGGTPCSPTAERARAFESALYALEEPAPEQGARNLCALMEPGRGVCALNMTGVFSRSDMQRVKQEAFQRLQAQCPGVMMAVGRETMGIANAEEAFQGVFAMLAAHVPQETLLLEPKELPQGYAVTLDTLVQGDEQTASRLVAEATARAWRTGCTDALRLLAEEINRQLTASGVETLPRPDAIAASVMPPSVERAYRSALRELWQSKPGVRNPTVRRAMGYLRKHYAEEISLPSLAEQLGVNPNYLSNVFKLETGVRLIESLNQIRLDAAMDLMRNSEHSIQEITEECGFRSVSYFYTVFKRAKGFGIREYRESMGKE